MERLDPLSPWEPRSLSILAIALPGDEATNHRLQALGYTLRARSDEWRVVSAHGVGSEDGAAATTNQPPPVDIYRTACAILSGLVATPADIIQVVSVRSTYAAFLACQMLAFRRPHWAPPALVTTLYGERSARQYAIAARHLRYLCDALILTAPAGHAVTLRAGFPAERAMLLRAEPTGVAAGEAGGADVRRVYVEARARAARWSQSLVAYEA